jgi:hypothetical protein
MVLHRAFAAALLSVLPCAVSAQTWADALKKGDYHAAAALLQPLVVEALANPISSDPEPARQLALLYAQGLGVTADAVTACGLAQVFGRAVQPGAIQTLDDMKASEVRVKAADEFVHAHCASLSERDRNLADRIGCFSFGMPEEVLMLGQEPIRVDREGIRLASDSEHKFEAPVNCPQLIARVRALTMEPPADAAPGVKARYFVDVLAWNAGPNDANVIRYVLGWQLFELREKKLELVSVENVLVADRWPSTPLPPDFDARLTLEMIRSGHVHWKIDGAPPKRGWVMLPETSR